MTIESQHNSNRYSSRFDQRGPAEYELPEKQESYPLAAIPPLIRGAIEDVWDELRAGHEVIATAALGIVSVVCQGFVNVKRTPTFPPSACSLFLVTVAGVSDAKSEVMKRFLTSVDEFERSEQRRVKEAGEVARKIRYETGSFAGFRRGLKERCRAAGILSVEAGNILNDPLITRHMPTWNALWSGEDLKETFSNVEYFVESPRWTASLMLQPDQFEKFLSKHGGEAVGNGFLARALVACPESSPSPQIDPDYAPSTARLAFFHQRVAAILGQPFPEPMECVVLTFSDPAYRYWTSYFNRLSQFINEGFFNHEMVGFVKKLPEQVARIAALFHYFSDFPIAASEQNQEPNQDGEVKVSQSGKSGSTGEEISEQTIRNAVRLCDWYMIEHAKHLHRHGKSAAPVHLSYEKKIDEYGRRLYDWVGQNYSRLSGEQRNHCIKIDYRKFQNAKRTISPDELQAAMDLLGRQSGFRVNFTGPGRGKFVCHEPNGNLCNHCVQSNVQIRSSSVTDRNRYSSGLQNRSNVQVSNPVYGSNVTAPDFIPVQNTDSTHQPARPEDATHESMSLLESIRTGNGSHLAD